MIYAFGSHREVVNADLPRPVIRKYNCPDRAYVYTVLASWGRVKIGQTTHTNWRIKQICGEFGYEEQQIFIVGPVKNWKDVERRLLVALVDYAIDPPRCVNVWPERFKLPRTIRAALRSCFLAGCTERAINEFIAGLPIKHKYHPMKTVIGTCSLCGGQVTTPHIWSGVTPPIPTCEQCHAQAASHGPVIPMKHQRPPETKKIWNTGGVPDVLLTKGTA